MGFYFTKVERGSSADEFARMSTEELRQFILGQDKALKALGIEMTVSMSKAYAKLKH